MAAWHLYIAGCAEHGGIYRYRFEAGRCELMDRTPADRPMYLEYSGGALRALLKAPFEGGGHSALVEWPVAADGSLGAPSAPVDTGGVEACHLCRWRGRTYAVNYASGSVFSSDGRRVVHAGRGVDPLRQEGPHPHFIAPAPDGECLLCVDLGLDAIISYDERLVPLARSDVPAGQGPRHLAFDAAGNTVFCANELGSSVSAFRYEGGRLSRLDTVPALPGARAENYPAAIRAAGDRVYVSNRGDDSVSVLHWTGERLEHESVFPCGGRWPRDIALVGDYILCANERSDAVSVLRGDGADTGLRLAVPAPVAILAVGIEGEGEG